MTAEARQGAFFREIDRLRQQSRRIEPEEIAQLARTFGLSAYESIFYLFNYGRPWHTSEIFGTLTAFISSACSRPSIGRILEYTNVPSAYVLTAPLVDQLGGPKLVYVAPMQPIARVLHTLFDERVVVAQSVTELQNDVAFDAIVCSPPLGHRTSVARDIDGFGGEVVRSLVPLLTERGILYWVTGRGVVFNTRSRETLAELEHDGYFAVATIDVPSGNAAMIDEVVIAIRRGAPSKLFVGAIRELATAEPTANAFLAPPSKKDGASWMWLDADDKRTFADVEHSRLLEALKPRGRQITVPLAALLMSTNAKKADRPLTDLDESASFLFVPEYAGSRVTADLDEQTVEPRAVYRLAVDTAKANPRFLARLLNSRYGRQLRVASATGVTIQRISAKRLLALELPIPDLSIQDRIARIDSDIGLLQAAFRDMQSALDQDWANISKVGDNVDALKAVLDIERQIADWWRELPYPLATIYRRYRVIQNPKERLDALLQFFEMAAVYLAAIGTSHVRAMRRDWQDVVARWLHPNVSVGIERPDFGFWINLAGASLKDTSRISSDKALREAAIDMAGPELVEVASTIGRLGKTTEVLDVARRQRNAWKGHGGLMKPSDALRLDGELQQSLRDFYEITAPVFRRFQLVRPGMAEYGESGFKFQIDKLSGSDPTFATEIVELDRPIKSNSLAFWMAGARAMCQALPFFRLGLPQQSLETSLYVFNRVEDEGGYRWISYQEAREQAIIAGDDELSRIISLGRQA